MKKNLLVLLVVSSMLMVFTGTASAAPLSGGTVTLVSADAGMNGTVFIFKVTGDFSKSELHGSAHVEGGDDYGIHCRQVDDETVRCTTSLKVQGNVVVTFGGSTFSTYIAPFTKYCYPIYDWWWFTGGEWTDFGPYCQGQPAQDGDQITYQVPDPVFGPYDSEPPVGFIASGDPDEQFGPCDPPAPRGQPAFYYWGCP